MRGGKPGYYQQLRRVFLLSPANSAGERARMLVNPRAKFELAARLQTEGAPIGELYSFISGLYFRGKLAYVDAFAAPPRAAPPALVITPSRGLVPPEMRITAEEFTELAHVPIHE